VQTQTLESLIVSAHRLGRIAARSTGDGTPAAVWRTLSILETDGPMRIGALAVASRVTQPGITRLVNEMVADGLLTRSDDPSDLRSCIVSLTKHGHSALEAWRMRIAEELTPMFDGLDDDDWAVLSRAAAILASRTAAAVQA